MQQPRLAKEPVKFPVETSHLTKKKLQVPVAIGTTTSTSEYERKCYIHKFKCQKFAV